MGKAQSIIRHRPDVRAAIAEFTAECKQARPPCWLCKQEIDYDLEFDPTNSGYFQADHYYPISTHPQHAADKGNLRPSHAGCNRERGNNAVIVLDNCSRDWENLG